MVRPCLKTKFIEVWEPILVTLAHGKQKQNNSEFNVIIGDVRNHRPVWATKYPATNRKLNKQAEK